MDWLDNFSVTYLFPLDDDEEEDDDGDFHYDHCTPNITDLGRWLNKR